MIRWGYKWKRVVKSTGLSGRKLSLEYSTKIVKEGLMELVEWR